MATEATNNGWHLSRQVWINLMAGIVAILGLIDESLLHSIGIANTTKWLAIIGFVVTAYNVIERMLKPAAADTTN